MPKPYLGPFFGAGELPGPSTLRVIYPGGQETFENVAYVDVLETGHLAVYRAERMDGQDIRLHPIAVFAPAGWNGFMTVEGGAIEQPLGFHQQARPGGA